MRCNGICLSIRPTATSAWRLATCASMILPVTSPAAYTFLRLVRINSSTTMPPRYISRSLRASSPCILARRPTDTKICSASYSPLVVNTLLPCTSVTLVSVRICMPALRYLSRRIATTSWSKLGRIVGMASMTVTGTPSS